jgi:Short repeat of unknown function (DUF308)
MLKSLSTSLIVRGILALAVGITALAWPGVTVLALVILFAVYAFIGAGLQAMRAFSSRSAGPVFGHLLLGLVDLAAGVVALAWPGPTALVLVLIVGSWAVVGGLLQIFAAFRDAGTFHPRRPGHHRVRRGAVRPSRRRRAHPRAAVRPVQPDLRRLGAHPRHRAAPDRQVPALRRPGQEGNDRCGLSLPDGSQAQHHPAERTEGAADDNPTVAASRGGRPAAPRRAACGRCRLVLRVQRGQRRPPECRNWAAAASPPRCWAPASCCARRRGCSPGSSRRRRCGSVSYQVQSVLI